MKKINTLILAALCFAAVSCDKEAAFQPEALSTGMKDVTFTVNNISSKFVLTDTFACNWEVNDSLAVYDSVGINVFKVVSCNGNEAVISGKVAEGTKHVTVIYPCSFAAPDAEDIHKLVIVNKTGEQYIPEGKNYSSEALFCMGDADFGNKVGLTQQAALYKFVLSNDVKKVRIAPNGEGTAVSIYPAKKGAMLASGTYYAAVYNDADHLSFTDGLNVVSCSNDKVYAKSSKNGADLFPGSILNLGNITSVEAFTNTITTKEEFELFRKYGCGLDVDFVVKLGADIDYGNTEIPSTDGICCQFDGQNHKVSGFSIASNKDVSFFGILYSGSSIKNLMIGTKDAETYDAYSIIKYTPDASSNYPIAASLSHQLQDSTTVDNVKSFVKITAQSSTDCLRGPTVSGLIAVINQGIVSNCTSYSDIECTYVTSQTDAMEHCVGGIIGRTNKGASIFSNLTYKGKIKIKDAKVTYDSWMSISGICGKTVIAPSKMENITFDGDIDVSLTNGTAQIGGIIGRTQNFTVDAKYSNWESKGSIKFTSAGTFVQGRVASIGGCIGNLQQNANKMTLENVNSSVAITIVKSDFNTNIGGIVANSTSSELTVNSCSFSGSIKKQESEDKTDGAATRTIGGIAGSTKLIKCTDCVFSGTIDPTTLNTVTNRVGGIEGQSTVNGCTFTNCKSTKESSICFGNKGSDGMIEGFVTKNNHKIINCKIAGKIQSGKNIVSITSENVGGYFYTANNTTVTLQNCGYNND